MSTTFSTLDVIRNHRLSQTTGVFSGVTKTAESTYHGVPPDSELATIAKNTPKPISGGISGSTSLVSPPKPITPAAPIHDLPHGSPGLGLAAGTRTDGTLMTPPIPSGPGVTGITEGFNAAVDREKVIAGDQAYNAQRFPAGSNGVTPEMIAQFRRRTGSNYNPNSRMDQHNMQLITSGGQTVNAQQFRKASPGLLAKTAAIDSIKVFIGITKTADDLETETYEPTDEAEQADRANREANPSIFDRLSGAASKVKSDFLRNAISGLTVGGAMGARRGVTDNLPTRDTLMDTGAGAALGGAVSIPLLSLVSAIQGFHSPPKKTAAFADGMISKYVLPRAGMFLQNAGTNVKWVGQHIGRVFGGAKPPPMAAINTLFNRKYQKLQSVFAKQPMSKQLAYGAAKRGAGYATGTAVGAGTAAAAINGFSGTINDRKKEEIGKAIGAARNTVHTAMSDPATRLKLGLSALFAPGAATSHIDDLLSKIQANATA
jgi:hypothetical protein